MSSIVRLAGGPAPADPDTFNRLPHVLLVVDGFPRSLGGGERILLRQAALLPMYGYRASILTLAWHPESSFQPADAPCPVYLLPLQSAYGAAALRGAADLRRLLRQENIRLVQTFFESSDLWAGIVTRAASSAKLVWSRRDMGILRGSKHRVAYRWLRRLPHAVFAVSEQVRAHAIGTDGIDPSRVHTIYNGVDLPAFRDSVVPAAAAFTKVVTLGNIRRVKGHDLFLRAAAQVLRVHPKMMFEIAGEVLDPDYMCDLNRLVEELGIAESVRFLGKVPDVHACVGPGSLFVLPSRSEGFSNALVEAMGSGVPVIATDVGGNAEAIQDGVTGWIVPSEDPDAMAGAILRVLAEPEQATRMGMAAASAVRQRFSTEAMMHAVAEAYIAILR